MNAPRRVLVVDDSAIVRRVVEAQLGLRPGLVVVGSVGSSEAALAAIDALQPDLVLMDACMPGMDGVEGARAVRARSAARVGLMTGSTGAEFRRYQVLGLSAGATCVLQKDGVGQGGFYDTVESVASEGRVRGVAPPAPAAPLAPRPTPAPAPTVAPVRHTSPPPVETPIPPPAAEPAPPRAAPPPAAPVNRKPPGTGGGLDDLFGMGATGDNTRIRMPKAEPEGEAARPRRPVVTSPEELARLGLDRRPPAAPAPAAPAGPAPSAKPSGDNDR